MKNIYRETIKRIIGPEAEKRGFKYTCYGGMNMTKPLAMYIRKDENLTQMIYIYQYKFDETQFVFDCGVLMKEKKYKCESFEEFEKAVNEVNEYLLNGPMSIKSTN